MPDRLERHIALLHWVGRFRRVRSNRWARWLFVRCQELLVRAFGTSEVEREVELDDGTRLLCDLRDNLQLTLFLLGSYQADDLQTILDAIHPGSLFIDVGAHVGLFSATVARHMQDGKVISFEPSPDTAARLRINLELNGVTDRVDVLEMGLSNESGSAQLREASGHDGDVGRRSLHEGGKLVASIPIRRLDDLVEKGEVVIDRPIGAIKIDVEGNEVPAMLGMEKLLSQHLARVIIVETVDSHLQRAGTSRTELIELMKRLGYRVQTSNGILGRPPINTAFVPRSSA